MPTPPTSSQLEDIRAQLVGAIKTFAEALWGYFGLAVSIYPPSDAPEAMLLYAESMEVSWHTIITSLPVLFAADAPAFESLMRSLWENIAAPLGGDVTSFWHGLLTDFLDLAQADLVKNAQTDPTEWESVASTALDRASLLGVGSRVVTVVFEALLPKKLNVFNWLGPILAQLSGYDEIIATTRKPQYDAAFGRLATYDANQKFRTRAPSGIDAHEMRARRLINPAQYRKILGWDGLMTEFEQPMLDAAYRPISVRSLIRAFVDVPLPIAQLRDTMEFTGNRPQDIDLMISAMQLQSVSSLRSQYISAVMTSAERGTLTTQEVADAILQSGQITDATHLAQLTIAVRKLEQLAEIYRKSITEAYTTGQITDAEYLPQLEAIGIAQADAEAHYAVDSIKVRGKQLSAEARAAARAAAALQRAQIQAALAAFRSS